MKKQRIRIYAALLCSSMVLSLVSTPVSAAETGQLTNPPTSTEELGSLESASGNEAAAALNGLSVSALTANRVAEVTTAKHLTDMLADSSVVLVVKFWAKKENYWQARYTMLEDIKYGFDEAGIRIPYPQMDVHLESGT